MIRFRVFFLAIFIVAVLVPCSYDTSPRFIPGYLPEKADTAFVQGQLGIISPSLNARYELIAWRYLSGLPLDPDEQKAALVRQAAGNVPAPVEEWRTAVGMKEGLYPWKRSKIAPGEFYTNCLDDAFTTALTTLEDRRHSYTDPNLVTAWIAAQETVFENCSKEPADYPADPEPGLPAPAKNDRLYQIAAAHFYAEDLDGAESRFRAIATATDSPWHDTAAYMVARTLIRKASLLKQPGALDAARAQLKRIESPSTAGLLRHLNVMADPSSAYRAIAPGFAAPHPDAADFEKTMSDAVYVLTAESFKAPFRATPDLPEPFDWVRALESRKSDRAVERWNATHSLPWLAAALIEMHGNDPAAPELIEAGLAVPETSPGFDTARFNAIRLLIERDDRERALTSLRPVLETARPLVAVNNSFRAERMQLATGFNDFLHWAPRHPIGYGDESLSTDEMNASAVLAEDSVSVLNRSTPLSMLADAVEKSDLPAWTRSDLAMVVWTRAFLLGNDSIADRMAPLLKWKGPTGYHNRFLGALLIVRHPEFRPGMIVDFRQKPRGEPNDFSWWCAIRPSAAREKIFSEAERATAAGEVEKLIATGPAQAALAPIIIGWAHTYPDDPLVPEALARLIRVTRYGCHPGPENGVISKQAFDLLHRKYPNDKWTKETPYWFN